MFNYEGKPCLYVEQRYRLGENLYNDFECSGATHLLLESTTKTPPNSSKGIEKVGALIEEEVKAELYVAELLL
jgi:hypothetical protein